MRQDKYIKKTICITSDRLVTSKARFCTDQIILFDEAPSVPPNATCQGTIDVAVVLLHAKHFGTATLSKTPDNPRMRTTVGESGLFANLGDCAIILARVAPNTQELFFIKRGLPASLLGLLCRFAGR